MRLIKERRWGDNPSPFYQRINWPLALLIIIIIAGVINVIVN
jgi:hypothetical protein